MKIIRYYLSSDITVKFLDEYGFEMDNTYSNFSRGTIKNPYDKFVWNHGYIGVGKYKTNDGKTATKEYQVWNNLMARCYSDKQRHLHPAYDGCTACDEWLNFQVFSQWYYDNFYQVGTERMHVDKDILVKGNKVYSPETCIFVPQRINMIFMEKEKKRDKDLPNTIYRCKTGYRASYNGKTLGIFKTLGEAIESHDHAKKIHIKQIANEYKNVIPLDLYEALYRY